MVAVKAHQAEAFLKSLERLPPAILFYGTDAGLVNGTRWPAGLLK